MARYLPILQHGIEARTTRNTALLALALTCPPPALHASLLEPLGPGGGRRNRTATFDARTEKARAEPLLLAPPDAMRSSTACSGYGHS